jgi:hypothetical protein
LVLSGKKTPKQSIPKGAGGVPQILFLKMEPRHRKQHDEHEDDEYIDDDEIMVTLPSIA